MELQLFPFDLIPMQWDSGDVWLAMVHLPSGVSTEYKFIKVDSTSGELVSWMDDATSPGEHVFARACCQSLLLPGSASSCGKLGYLTKGHLKVFQPSLCV